MQNKVLEFNLNHQEPMPVSARILDVQSELGELGKEVLKASCYGTEKFKKTEDFEMELGDVLYSLLSLANETEIDAEIALDKVLEKYRKRIEDKGNMGSGN